MTPKSQRLIRLSALVFAASLCSWPLSADDDIRFPSLTELGLPAAKPVLAPAGEIPSAPAQDPTKKASEDTEVSHLAQFADPSDRSQCNVGSCHAFSSIAVLEAAYKRAYGSAIRFSEADLFIRRTVLSGDIYKAFCATSDCKLSEGSDVLGDVDYAIANGVASSLQYQEFYERYKKYREAEQKTLEGLKKTYDEMSWLEKLFYDPRAHWKELESRPLNKKIKEAFLAGHDPRIGQERADSKAKIGSFKSREKRFKHLGDKAPKMKKEECRAEGTGQGKAILAELNAGRPVSISMILKGLSAWGTAGSTDHANHAFTIVGYKTEKTKPTVLHTRNSWGGDNPNVHEHELCRVYSVLTVLTPSEKAAF